MGESAEILENETEKQPFHLELGTFRHWTPTEEYLEKDQLFPDTSYAASLALIYANRGIEPEVLLVRQNPDDPERFLQHRGGTRTRSDGWKMPIGRFTPYRYTDDDGNGILDENVWDTVIEEFWEETGIDFRDAGEDEEKSREILQSLKMAPVAEYRMPSKRPPHMFHIDRVHFLVTPECLVPNKEVWKKAIELKEVRRFPLRELPRKDVNGEESSMLYSHVRRLVEFFECKQASSIKWQSGIPDDMGGIIRDRFPEFKIPR